MMFILLDNFDFYRYSTQILAHRWDEKIDSHRRLKKKKNHSSRQLLSKKKGDKRLPSHERQKQRTKIFRWSFSMSWTPFFNTRGEKKEKRWGITMEKERDRVRKQKKFFQVINTFSPGWNNNTRIGETYVFFIDFFVCQRFIMLPLISQTSNFSSLKEEEEFFFVIKDESNELIYLGAIILSVNKGKRNFQNGQN